MATAELKTFLDRSLRGQVWGTVQVGNRTWDWQQWDGQRLASQLLGLDTETTVVEPGRVPRLAVVQVCDGRTCYLVHPDDAAKFVLAHRGAAYVCHNAAFDWHVLYRHLLRQDRTAARSWLSVVDRDRLSDTMLLDQLVRIARGSSNPVPRNLAAVAEKWAQVHEVDKNDPWRLRYAETIGKPWNTIDRAAWEYAAKDAIVTRLAYLPLRDAAREMVRKYRIPQQVLERFGPLSIRLQVRAAIALNAVEQRGIRIDQQRREQTQQQLRDQLDELVAELGRSGSFSTVFVRSKKTGQLQLTPTGKPRLSQKILRQVLEQVALENGIVPERTSSGEVGLSRTFWSEHTTAAPFVSLWLQLEETAKLLQFFAKLGQDRIHPRYTVLVRTGRTSCHSPNIQQMPRSGRFREMFVPRPGCVFLIVDYAALELRTLAAVCLEQFGESVLADTIRNGQDPHCYTAALLSDLAYSQFLDLKQSEPQTFKRLRQAAKAVNFGVPGGLGPAALQTYARLNYGTDLSLDEATQFRERFLSEVYPEVGQYLADDLAQVLARNLHCPTSEVLRLLPSAGIRGAAKRIVQGLPKANGEQYEDSFVRDVWQRLRQLNRNRLLEVDPQLAGPELERQLFLGSAVTTTGRIRGRTSFTQRHNTPFQGLAADGAKLALWKLYRSGFRTVSHIHDEFVIELDRDEDLDLAAERIDRICVESMQEVTGTVPIETEYAVASCWSKEAELLRDEQGRIQVWEPQQ